MGPLVHLEIRYFLFSELVNANIGYFREDTRLLKLCPLGLDALAILLILVVHVFDEIFISGLNLEKCVHEGLFSLKDGLCKLISFLGSITHCSTIVNIMIKCASYSIV